MLHLKNYWDSLLPRPPPGSRAAPVNTRKTKPQLSAPNDQVRRELTAAEETTQQLVCGGPTALVPQARESVSHLTPAHARTRMPSLPRSIPGDRAPGPSAWRPPGHRCPLGWEFSADLRPLSHRAWGAVSLRPILQAQSRRQWRRWPGGGGLRGRDGSAQKRCPLLDSA